MLPSLFYLLAHYLWFGVFVFAFWAVGNGLLFRVFKLPEQDGWLRWALAVLVGQGLWMVGLQCLGVAGLLRLPWVGAGLAGCALWGLWQMVQIWQNRSAGAWPGRTVGQVWGALPRAEMLGLVFLLVFAFPTLLEPLRPPWPGDELTYHLPHAQLWAQSGQLSINEWLRYPWFPYNYNLLYAAAIVVHGDVMPHLFNALAGWLVALLVYRLGKRWFNTVVACGATFIWLHMNRGEFGRTLVDIGTSLYTFASAFVFLWWVQAPRDRRWLAVSAFLLGVAVGSKYQALFILPIFGLAVLVVDRRVSTLLLAACSLLLPCIYWYARNALVTGDPFNPMGGKLFGFYDWNAVDFAAQFADLRTVADWPAPLLWPALLALRYLREPLRSARFGASLLCVYFYATWAFTSHYPRYLMPVVPWLALFAAQGWYTGIGWLGVQLRNRMPTRPWRWLVNTLWACVLGAALVSSTAIGITYWSYICPSPQERLALMRKTIKGFAVLEYAKAHPLGRIYMSDGLHDMTYYAPWPIWGDSFGPWRFVDFVSNVPETFFRHLQAGQFDAVIVNDNRANALESNADFAKWFTVEFRGDGFRIYRLTKHLP